MGERPGGQIDLGSMALFVRIVEEGSLSAGGRSLRLTKATVSRRLVLLERSIGTPLLIRSTRAISLTDAGRRFFERVKRIVHDVQAVQSEFVNTTGEPAGVLRIGAPIVFGQTVIAPAVVKFLAAHPKVHIDLHLSDERVNVVAEGFDLVVRMGDLPDSDLISRRLADVSVAIVAAPSYLSAHGQPDTLQDLRGHTAVLTRKTPDHWTINGEIVRVPWRMCTGSMMVTRDAVRAGLGIALMPSFFIADDLEKGSLMRVLPDVELPKSYATALYPRSIIPSPALRALLEVFSEKSSY